MLKYFCVFLVALCASCGQDHPVDSKGPPPPAATDAPKKPTIKLEDVNIHCGSELCGEFFPGSSYSHADYPLLINSVSPTGPTLPEYYDFNFRSFEINIYSPEAKNLGCTGLLSEGVVPLAMTKGFVVRDGVSPSLSLTHYQLTWDSRDSALPRLKLMVPYGMPWMDGQHKLLTLLSQDALFTDSNGRNALKFCLQFENAMKPDSSRIIKLFSWSPAMTYGFDPDDSIYKDEVSLSFPAPAIH